MKFLNKYFGKTVDDPFDLAPFLFPWYVTDQKPELIRHKEPLSWHYLEKVKEEFVGLTELCCGAEVLGLFKIYTYIFASHQRDCFCVWKRSTNNRNLNIDIFLTSDLLIFDNIDEAAIRFHGDENTSYLLNCKPSFSFSIPLNPAEQKVEMKFPDALDSFEDFIAVVGSSNLNPGTTLVEIKPKDNIVLFHPQDWFNDDKQIDLGYQWITRAIRDRSTGRILGQGIRIDPFELDETNRQLTPASLASRNW